MKYGVSLDYIAGRRSLPTRGAWIEMDLVSTIFRKRQSLPTRGAWIEIVLLAKGGHPSDINNLQLAHMTCNRDKSDKLVTQKVEFSGGIELISNRLLPLTFDWKSV